MWCCSSFIGYIYMQVGPRAGYYGAIVEKKRRQQRAGQRHNGCQDIVCHTVVTYSVVCWHSRAIYNYNIACPPLYAYYMRINCIEINWT